MIEEGLHGWNCMAYIELNMVRAGRVAHPAQWPWCSYGEWMGERRRYRVIDTKECLRVLGGASLEEFRANYDALIVSRLAKDSMAREPQWTESIAVGSRTFVEGIGQKVRCRQRLESSPIGDHVWVLRDLPLPAASRTLEARMGGVKSERKPPTGDLKTSILLRFNMFLRSDPEKDPEKPEKKTPRVCSCSPRAANHQARTREEDFDAVMLRIRK